MTGVKRPGYELPGWTEDVGGELGRSCAYGGGRGGFSRFCGAAPRNLSRRARSRGRRRLDHPHGRNYCASTARQESEPPSRDVTPGLIGCRACAVSWGAPYAPHVTACVYRAAKPAHQAFGGDIARVGSVAYP